MQSLPWVSVCAVTLAAFHSLLVLRKKKEKKRRKKNMNNHQLYSIAKSHLHTRYLFKNCITPDTCPTWIQRPAAYICNSNMSNSDGKQTGHWLALVFPASNQASEFFDSRGQPLSHYSPEIRHFLISNGNGKIKTNSTPYQASNTKTCGHFCLWFIDRRGMKYTYENSLKCLSDSNQSKNEEYVINYVMKHMTPTPV